MACRNILNLLCKRNRPIWFAMASSFIQYDPDKKPNSEEKINLLPPEKKDLSFDYMMKQSAIESVNSASQTLTVTYSAIEAVSKEYRKLLVNIISLLQESLIREVSDEHWDVIVLVRGEMQKKKQTINRLVGYVEYVQKMAVATTEVTFLTGMDNLSVTLCQRIDDAVNNIQKEIAQNKILEEEYTVIQQKCILKDKDDPPEIKIVDLAKQKGQKATNSEETDFVEITTPVDL
ncbi:uncharacterized protein LOC122501167 [Leptopilina heterotoma]|uniref:uncharacterized protein LOC122501167 n=1 Tax=Leptopilina heterotoma TaxID=63436 RepID=UPI001CAA38C3|nr:uncharacterized protein LOC122501167 [Leptopilina heterotoma]